MPARSERLADHIPSLDPEARDGRKGLFRNAPNACRARDTRTVFIMQQLDSIRADALSDIEAAPTAEALQSVRVAFLGRKGRLTAAQTLIKDLPKEERPQFGQLLNATRSAITAALDEKGAALQADADRRAVAAIDVTLPPRNLHAGGLHPLTIIKNRAIVALRQMGFTLAVGPEIETEFHCFDALNTPKDHPARNETDTFYFDSGKLLRTHTSSVQVRTMESSAPPVRIIAPGSAYRRDEMDATHLSVFNQLEGLYVDENVTVGHLKGTLERFFVAMFGRNTQARFRPHFFPFTEPSFEIDIKLEVAGKAPRWIEVAGCGMVDPAVFDAVHQRRNDDVFHPDKVTGFAFGMGLDRLAMIQWSIRDIRLLIENDVRFLEQFV